MKKIVTLSLVALVAIASIAQEQRLVDNSRVRINRSEISKEQKHVSESDIALTITDKQQRAQKVAASLQDTLMYLRPYGSFFGGHYPGGNFSYPRIYISDTTDVVFGNASIINSGDSTVLWGFTTSAGQKYLISDEKWELDFVEAGFSVDSAGAAYYMPWMAQYDDELMPYNFYQYGAAYSDYAALVVLPDFQVSISNLALYTDTLINKSGLDKFRVGAGNNGKYCIGTGFKLGNITVDTVNTIFENFGSFLTDTMIINLYSDAAEATRMIPAGKSIKVEVLQLQVNEQGRYVYTNNVLASFDVTNNDIHNAEEYNGIYYGDIELAFGQKNALGGFTPAPIQLEGLFYVRISGLSQEGLDFGIFTDYYYPEGTTHFLAGGDRYSFNGGAGNNIALSLQGQFVDGSSTAVENVNATEQAVAKKVMRNGQVLIEKNGKTYNVLGAEVK